MLDTYVPALRSGAQVRTRSDGSAGVCDTAHGLATEVAADQVQLLELIDGKRTLSELAAVHHERHGSVPFSALRDLLGSLAEARLLVGGRTGLATQTSKRWIQRLAPRELLAFSLPALGALSVVVVVMTFVAAFASLSVPDAALDVIDVPLAFVGVTVALSVRGFARATLSTLFGQAPKRLAVTATCGVPHLTPDTNMLVLLDRGQRVAALLGGLVGMAAVVFASSVRPGLEFGATVAVLADLCPFAPTSVGRLLATLSGRVDLREHTRAYLSKQFLKRATSTRFFAGEAGLIVSALLSLAWLCLVVRVLLTDGVITVLQLAALGMGATGLDRMTCYLGALVLALAMPASVVVLIAAVVRAVLSLRGPSTPPLGTHGGSATVSDFAAVPLFSTLDEAGLATLSARAKELRYGVGKPVVTQGAASDSFFVIRSGVASVQLESESGLVREVARLGPGDCFGESALLESGVRGATVRALEPLVVAALTRADFEQVRGQLRGVDVTTLVRASAALKKSRFFGELPAARISTLAIRSTRREVKAGDVLVTAGERGDDFFLVGEGTFEVLGNAGGAVSTLGPGDHFGEIALLRDVPRTATVRATSEGSVLVLSKDTFIRAIAADLSVSAQLEQLAAQRAEAGA